MSSPLTCFLCAAESYSNPLAPEGHELDDHRAAAQWVSHTVCSCVCLFVCACLCVLTISVSSGPNWPMMTSGSCWWRHGRRHPRPRPPNPDTMSEWGMTETPAVRTECDDDDGHGDDDDGRDWVDLFSSECRGTTTRMRTQQRGGGRRRGECWSHRSEM